MCLCVEFWVFFTFCLPIFAYKCISCYNFQIKIKSREKTQEKTIYAPFSADENIYKAVPVHSNVITTNPTNSFQVYGAGTFYHILYNEINIT